MDPKLDEHFEEKRRLVELVNVEHPDFFDIQRLKELQEEEDNALFVSKVLSENDIPDSAIISDELKGKLRRLYIQFVDICLILLKFLLRVYSVSDLRDNLFNYLRSFFPKIENAYLGLPNQYVYNYDTMQWELPSGVQIYETPEEQEAIRKAQEESERRLEMIRKNMGGGIFDYLPDGRRIKKLSQRVLDYVRGKYADELTMLINILRGGALYAKYIVEMLKQILTAPVDAFNRIKAEYEKVKGSKTDDEFFNELRTSLINYFDSNLMGSVIQNAKILLVLFLHKYPNFFSSSATSGGKRKRKTLRRKMRGGTVDEDRRSSNASTVVLGDDEPVVADEREIHIQFYFSSPKNISQNYYPVTLKYKIAEGASRNVKYGTLKTALKDAVKDVKDGIEPKHNLYDDKGDILDKITLEELGLDAEKLPWYVYDEAKSQLIERKNLDQISEQQPVIFVQSYFNDSFLSNEQQKSTAGWRKLFSEYVLVKKMTGYATQNWKMLLLGVAVFVAILVAVGYSWAYLTALYGSLALLLTAIGGYFYIKEFIMKVGFGFAIENYCNYSEWGNSLNTTPKPQNPYSLKE
jgi:hypothetical protein